MGTIIIYNDNLLTTENAKNGYRLQGTVCFYPPEHFSQPDEYGWVDREWDFKLTGQEAQAFTQSRDLQYLLDLYFGLEGEEERMAWLCKETDEESSEAETNLTITLLTEEQKKQLPQFAGSAE